MLQTHIIIRMQPWSVSSTDSLLSIITSISLVSVLWQVNLILKAEKQLPCLFVNYCSKKDKMNTYQVPFRWHTDQDEVITHSDLLPLWPLFRSRMDCPPACLTCRTYQHTCHLLHTLHDQLHCQIYCGLCWSPVESSCKPTSKASLSVRDRDVVKQLRYCSRAK